MPAVSFIVYDSNMNALSFCMSCAQESKVEDMSYPQELRHWKKTNVSRAGSCVKLLTAADVFNWLLVT